MFPCSLFEWRKPEVNVGEGFVRFNFEKFTALCVAYYVTCFFVLLPSCQFTLPDSRNGFAHLPIVDIFSRNVTPYLVNSGIEVDEPVFAILVGQHSGNYFSISNCLNRDSYMWSNIVEHQNCTFDTNNFFRLSLGKYMSCEETYGYYHQQECECFFHCNLLFSIAKTRPVFGIFALSLPNSLTICHLEKLRDPLGYILLPSKVSLSPS